MAQWEARLEVAGRCSSTLRRNRSAIARANWRWNGPSCGIDDRTGGPREGTRRCREAAQLIVSRRSPRRWSDSSGSASPKSGCGSSRPRRRSSRRGGAISTRPRRSSPQEKADLTEQLRELDRQRRQFQEQTARQQRALAAQEQQVRKEQQRRDAHLNQRETELDNREAAIEQMRTELRHDGARSARDAAGDRGDLEPAGRGDGAGDADPVDFDRAGEAGRPLSADAQEDLRRSRRSWNRSAATWLSNSTRSKAQRHELQQWAQRRHEDIEHQASRLVAREQELDRQQQHYEQMESRWHLEQIEYQAEIRRLLAALRSLELKAA